MSLTQKMFAYFVYFEQNNKITPTAENTSTVQHNLVLLDMSIFNGLIIKITLLKKQNPSLFLWKGFNYITTKSWY